MNNLTTRKIVLGMLMALVLMFSMQGIAEAITKFTKTSSTDKQIASIQQPFTIGFSVSLQDKQRIPDNAGTGYVDQDGPAIDSNGYFLDGNGFYKNAANQSIDSSGYLLDTNGLRQNANGDAIDSSGYLLDTNGLRQNANGDAIDSSGYLLDTNGNRLVPLTLATGGTNPTTQVKATTGTNPTTQLKAVDTVRTKTTPLKQYHYNEQSISIAHSGVSGGSITFTKGSTAVTSLSQDAEESDERLSSSSVSLSCRADTAGVYTITIGDTTDDSDVPSGYTAATPITFMITVLQSAETTRGLTVTSGLSDAIVGEFGTKGLSVSVSGTTANARVEFEITKGSGSISAENTVGSKTSKRLSTLTNSSGIATVTLDPKKGTNHVRAWIFGNSPGTTGKSTEGIYIYRWASLNKVSGDAGDSGDPQQNQKGPVSSRLGKPFVVQLFDSTGRTTIPGAEITFTPGDTGGTLSYDPSTPTNLRVSLVTEAKVKTDSNGKASIFLVLGVLAGEGYTVTARYGPLVTSFDTQTFTATSLADTVTSKATSITKVAETDGQSADEYGFLKKPLTVVVRDQGRQRLAHTNGTNGTPVIVRFLTLNGGDLTAPADSEPGTLSTESDALDTDGAKDITTDANGEASVIYTAPEEGGRRTVRASINNSLKSVVFTINGTPSSGGGGGGGGGGEEEEEEEEEEDEDTTGNTITVRPIILSGAPGAVVPLGLGPITTNFTVTGNAAFTAAGGLVSETGAIRDVRLPNTAGTAYALTVSATGYTSVTVPVTVTAAASTGLGTLTVSKDGAQVGTQQPVLVGASPAPSSNLVFTITSGGFRVGGGEITTAGSGKAIVSVPTASGLYTLSVSATGYTTAQVTFTASAQTVAKEVAPTEEVAPTVGEPSRITVSGLATQSGTVNAQLDLPLAVRVLDANGTGVPDARVIFSVISGRGKLSERGNGRAIRIQTDSGGYARANFTPTDGGSSTVQARATGVTATVTFTITTGSAPGARDSGTGGTPGAISFGCAGCACRCGEPSADVMGRRGCDLRTCGRESPKIRIEC